MSIWVCMDFELPLSQWILSAISRVDRFNERWAAGPGIAAPRLARMAEAARIQSVAASCRLSGIRVSDADVAGLLRGAAVPLRDAADVLGYAAALGRGLPPTERVLRTDDIRMLHATLIAGGAEPGAPTPWRRRPHQFETFDAEGHTTGQVFSALPPRMIDEKVEDLLTWLELELRSADRHAVLVVGTFMLGFLAASPFEKMNGRMARLLSYHLLVRAGYAYLPYGSLERQMEELREPMQEAYSHSERLFWMGRPDLGIWLERFLETLVGHCERVEAKTELERDRLTQTPLQQSILELVREHGSVDAGLLLEATGANRNTLKDNLRKLVERGTLERTGQRRGTRYRLAAADRARNADGSPRGQI